MDTYIEMALRHRRHHHRRRHRRPRQLNNGRRFDIKTFLVNECFSGNRQTCHQV